MGALNLDDSSIVVTGLGIMSPIGLTKEDFWASMMAGRSGVDRIQSFDPSGLTSQIAAEIRDFDPQKLLPPKQARRMSRTSQLAAAAALAAVEDAGLDFEAEDRSRIGCIIGSGGSDMRIIEEEHLEFMDRGQKAISVLSLPKLIPNMPSSNVSILLNLNGPNMGVASACATGAHAIAAAVMALRAGLADVMLTGGAESAITPLTTAAYAVMRVLSSRNDEPQRASRPFDADRDGFVVGEGAAVLVLERWDRARKRGARPLAAAAGLGLTADAHSIAAPHPTGYWAAKAMELAVKDAGISPDAIGYINAHGTSTELNDKLETAAIKACFGEELGRTIPVSSTKSMVGHSMGAAGAVEAAATVLAVERGVLPPSINYETPDPECDLNIVANQPREAKIEAALSNSFGFGGQNGALVFTKV